MNKTGVRHDSDKPFIGGYNNTGYSRKFIAAAQKRNKAREAAAEYAAERAAVMAAKKTDLKQQNAGAKEWLGETVFDQILYRICRVFKCTRREIIGRGQGRKVVFARKAICYWAYRSGKYSMNWLGDTMDGRDHTTILHNIQTYHAERGKMNRKLKKILKRGDHGQTKI